MTDRRDHDDDQDAGMTDVERILASMTDEDLALGSPPAGSWDSIERRLAIGDADAGPGIDDASNAGRRLSAVPGDPVRGDGSVDRDDATLVDLGERRRRRWTRIAIGVAAAAVVTVGASALFVDRAEAPVATASAVLVHEPVFDPIGEGATATVSIVESGDGFAAEFSSAELPGADDLASGEQLELWLLEDDADGDVVRLRSLGVVDAASPGRVTIPDDVDLDEFGLVDISVEPDDGDDGHSGRSILRGRITA